MSDVLHMVYDEIASVKSLEQFRLKISECVERLDKEGLIDIAYEIKELFQKNLPCLKIENEYDVQRLMYPVIRTVFPNARIEVTEDSGHHTVRKDIVIDSCNIVIELKCTSETVTERRISDEIAADMVHYGNRYIFFYIYDKGNVIKNALDFRNTYERTSIEDKKAFVRIWQSNDI